MIMSPILLYWDLQFNRTADRWFPIRCLILGQGGIKFLYEFGGHRGSPPNS